MKNFSLIWCTAGLLLVAASAMAEEGYGVAWWNGNNSVGWTLNAGGEGAARYNSFTACKDSSLTLTVEANKTSGFTYGTFQYTQTADGAFNIVDGSMQTLGTVGSSETGQSGTSSAYSSGDMVGVWVQSEGMTLYSVNSLNPGTGGQYTEGNVQAGKGIVWFDDRGSWPGQWNADIKIGVVGVAPVTPAASGSPLPGVWVTMALAGAVGGYIKRRKNRS